MNEIWDRRAVNCWECGECCNFRSIKKVVKSGGSEVWGNMVVRWVRFRFSCAGCGYTEYLRFNAITMIPVP